MATAKTKAELEEELKQAKKELQKCKKDLQILQDKMNKMYKLLPARYIARIERTEAE